MELPVVGRVDRTARRSTVTTTVPGSTTVGVTVAINGLKASETSTTGALVTQTYDAYARPLRTTTRQDASIGDDVYEEIEYYPGTTQVKHRKNLYLGGSGFQQTYYDNMGRVSVERVNDSVQWKTRRFAYTARGELYRAWGSGQNPVEYQYNSYGWRTHMRLYRQTSGINWDDAYWPGSPGTADETEWRQHGPTGLVEWKDDPANARVSFTYNKRSQVATRTWARNVTTTYAYCESAGYRTGEISSISYNDSTPTVTYSYQDGANYLRHGLPRTITDATGIRTHGYRIHDLQQESESLDEDFYGEAWASGPKRGVWRYYDGLARPYAVKMGFDNAIGHEHESYYFYDGATGRVSTVLGHRLWVYARYFDYTYRPGSNLVSAIADQTGQFRRDTQHQSWREVIEQVETKWSGVSRAKFTYNHDWVGKYTDRTIAQNLAAALGYASGLKDEYLYTSRSEVDWTISRDLSNGDPDTNKIPNRYRDWAYDAQGNREDEWTTGTYTDFALNNRNQYASVGGIGYSHDADGNLTNDGVWSYTWDGENRLASAQKNDGNKRLEITYDYMSRRVRKVVKNGDIYAPIVFDHRYIYDGWNLVDEIDALQAGAAYASVACYSWGLDVTGTVHGGGGVGGLLIFANSTGTYLPLIDANGNIHGLLDNGAGAVVAAYAYSATGEILGSFNPQGGSHAENNPFRFASKFYDEETGLYQYNHRYYSPRLGRFISRDPIAENGGLNLYAYCGNDPLNHYDYLGTSWLSKAFRKIGRWVKNNWRSIVGVILNTFVPGLGLAWNMGVGLKYGGLKGLALGLAGSFVGGRLPFGKGGIGLNLGGRIAGSLNKVLNFGADSFAGSVVNGYVTGGISGGTTAALSGQNFWGGFRAGGTTGAVLAAGSWGWQNPSELAEPLRRVWGRSPGPSSRVGSLADRSANVIMEPLQYEDAKGVWRELGTDEGTGYTPNDAYESQGAARAQEFITSLGPIVQPTTGSRWRAPAMPAMADSPNIVRPGLGRGWQSIRQVSAINPFWDAAMPHIVVAPLYFAGGSSQLVFRGAGAAWNLTGDVTAAGIYITAHGGQAAIGFAVRHPYLTYNVVDFAAEWFSAAPPSPTSAGGVAGVAAQRITGNPLEWGGN